MTGTLGTGGGEGGDSPSAATADDALIGGADQDATSGGVDYDFFVFDAVTDSDAQNADMVLPIQGGERVGTSAIDGDPATLAHADDVDPNVSADPHSDRFEFVANDNAKPEMERDVEADLMLQAAYFLL